PGYRPSTAPDPVHMPGGAPAQLHQVNGERHQATSVGKQSVPVDCRQSQARSLPDERGQQRSISGHATSSACFTRPDQAGFPNTWVWASYFAVPITGTSRALSVIRQRDQHLPMSAPTREAGNAEERPADLAQGQANRATGALSAPALICVRRNARGLPALA